MNLAAWRPGERGYTLAEMLAALLIVSLAMGGVMQASYMLERQQRTTLANTRTLDSSRQMIARFRHVLAIYRVPAEGQPDLDGSAKAFAFPCGNGNCGAQLEGDAQAQELRLNTPAEEVYQLETLRNPHFVYVAQGGEDDSWPLASSSVNPLRAVLLVAEGVGGDLPVATARVWRQEPLGCAFDAIARACRRGGP